jgi:hypothetical protein
MHAQTSTIATLIVYGLVIFGAVAGAYVALVAWSAKYDTKTAPKTDMHVCDIHGAFPAKYTMQLTGITEKPIAYCPFCWENRIKEAKAKMK